MAKEKASTHRHQALHRMPELRDRLQAAARIQHRPRTGALGHRFHGSRSSRRQVRPQAVHALRGSGLRFGLPGGRNRQDAARAGGLQRRQVHWLPLLHAGLPLPGAAIPVDQARAVREEVRYVYRPREGRQADGVRGSVPGASDGLRRSR